MMADRPVSHILTDCANRKSFDHAEPYTLNEGNKTFIKKFLSPMVQLLDDLLDDNGKDQVSGHLARAMAVMDMDILSSALTQKLESDFGEKLFQGILHELGDQKLEQLIIQMQTTLKSRATGSAGYDPSPVIDIKRAFKKLTETGKGQKAYNNIKSRRQEERAEKEKEKAELKSRIESIAKGETNAFKDERILRSLPPTVLQLFAQQNETAWAVMRGIGAGLAGDDKEIRAGVSEMLLAIVDELHPEKRIEVLDEMQNPLTHWIELENSLTPGYRKICYYLGKLGRHYMRKRQLTGYRSILNTFQQIGSSDSQKDDETRLAVAKALNSMTNEDVLTALIEELQSGDEDRCDQAAGILTQLGDDSVKPLLDLLEKSPDGSTRSRILLVLSDIGQKAVPPVRTDIQTGKPWYYIRNLAKLLGNIGDENCLDVLRPLLMNKEYRVQWEALNSIFAIGGEKRTEIFLSALVTVDDRLKVDIIGMLGDSKWGMAESVFLEMLESKALAASKARNDLSEKICNVLGSIGTKKSVPALISIIEQKRSLIRKRPFNEKVRTAALNAWAKIEEMNGGASL